MPVQTQHKSKIFFPDGAKVSVKLSTDSDWYDVGAINSSVTNTLNWTESTVETANAGQLDTKVSNMEMAGGFTLINLDPVGIGKMGGGVFEVNEVAGDAVTPDAQVLAAVTAGEWYAMELMSSGAPLNLPSTTAKPVITSVMKGSSALTEGDDYTIVKVDGAFKISFVAASSDAITITYGSNTPVASVSISAGSSSIVMKPYAMKIDHVDDNGKHRTLELYSVYSNGGGFQFNFKGANEDGVEEMPITFTGRLDTSRLNKHQLFTWTIENGAA